MSKSHGPRRKTRRKLSKPYGVKTRVTDFFKDISIGDKVVVKIDPAIHKGHPHPRFQGRYGVVSDKRGSAYIINVKDGRKTKQLIATAVHLKKI